MIFQRNLFPRAENRRATGRNKVKVSTVSKTKNKLI